MHWHFLHRFLLRLIFLLRNFLRLNSWRCFFLHWIFLHQRLFLQTMIPKSHLRFLLAQRLIFSFRSRFPDRITHFSLSQTRQLTRSPYTLLLKMRVLSQLSDHQFLFQTISPVLAITRNPTIGTVPFLINRMEDPIRIAQVPYLKFRLQFLVLLFSSFFSLHNPMDE